MAKILESLQNTVIAGIVLALLILGSQTGWFSEIGTDTESLKFYARYLHILSATMWIGLLWYFNFVQIPLMPSIPAEMKPAIGKFIAPKALFYFRWSAMATLLTGLLLGVLSDYLVSALTLSPDHLLIGLGMWMAIIMWFNVWFIIWPNQKVALGMVDGDADAKLAAGRKAMLFSRTNTLLSIPMLLCMVGQMHGGL